MLHALDLLDPQGEQEEPDRERQEDDRDAVVRDDVVDPRENPAQRVEEPLPQAVGDQALHPGLLVGCLL